MTTVSEASAAESNSRSCSAQERSAFDGVINLTGNTVNAAMRARYKFRKSLLTT